MLKISVKKGFKISLIYDFFGNILYLVQQSFCICCQARYGGLQYSLCGPRLKHFIAVSWFQTFFIIEQFVFTFWELGIPQCGDQSVLCKHLLSLILVQWAQTSSTSILSICTHSSYRFHQTEFCYICSHQIEESI